MEGEFAPTDRKILNLGEAAARVAEWRAQRVLYSSSFARYSERVG